MPYQANKRPEPQPCSYSDLSTMQRKINKNGYSWELGLHCMSPEYLMNFAVIMEIFENSISAIDWVGDICIRKSFVLLIEIE